MNIYEMLIAKQINGGGGITPTGTIEITENGTGIDVAQYAYADVNVSGGGAEEKDVNFYDYDGTLLYSYTAQEFANLSEMPANPTHTGLTAQGWNWSLADAKTQVARYGYLDIGQMYVTSDGKTRLYVTIVDPSLPVSANFYIPTGEYTVDWGDGTTSTSTAHSSGYSGPTHTYSAPGNYVITVDSGVAVNGSQYMNLIASIASSSYYKRSLILKKVELGNIVAIQPYAFARCSRLESITIPKNTPINATNTFAYCQSLKHLTIPSGTGDISFTSMFDTCTQLETVSFPNEKLTFGSAAIGQHSRIGRIFQSPKVYGYLYYTYMNYLPSEVVLDLPNASFVNLGYNNCVTKVVTDMLLSCPDCKSLETVDFTQSTKINSYAFNNCTNISDVTIPATVTEIGNNAFANCALLSTIHVLPTTPPTLGNSSVFYASQGMKIYVPHGTLNTYQNETNWSTYASYMVEESA